MIREGMLRVVELQGPRAVHHVTPVPPSQAHGLVDDVYAEIRREFLLAPPFLLHSPVPTLLAGAWSVVRETLIAGRVARARKEAVATAVSKLNHCPFCVEAHTMSVQAAAGRHDAEAVEAGRADAIADDGMRRIVAWAAATRTPGSSALRTPPFSRADAPEVIGTALAFHYVNRMVNLFCDESPLPLPTAMRGLRGFVRRISAPLMSGLVAQAPAPGASLERLPKRELPEDLRWSEGNPAVSGAFAGLAAVLDEQAERFVPSAVRELVAHTLADWHGEEPDLGRGWVEKPVAPLDEADRPAARLALLAALASYQVDATILADYRARRPDDAALLTLTAWAAFAAARRVGSWLPLPTA